MPPKKKGGKKKGKKSSKSKTPTVVDGVSTVEMSHEQLEEHIIRLREELEREREERNYFQLEKDKITNFWEITKHQLEERSSELRNKEREAEEAEERHQLELKMHAAREKFSQQLEDQRNLYQKKLKELRDEMDLQRKNELHETEERKNNQINNLMRNHEKAFANIKNYYNDITLNNLALINTLKEQLDEKRKKEERLEKQAADLVSENRRLTEPLQKALEENTEMKRQVANCEKDKIVLRQTKTLLRTCEKEKKHAEWKFDILEERFKHVERERDELYEKFVSAIHEVQQKTGLKNMLLEKRLLSLTETIEKKEAQLSEVLTASNLDPTALASVTRKLGDILDSKNIAIKELQYELARVCKAHNDLIQACEGKMKQFGIPVEELGFKPLKTTLCTQKLGMSPAGLVSVPP
ncbi:Growth arrest-specific protein 8 [Paragonimus heterotremus]|uniref:Dynein regulatory complex subunit 4 n=1 Tax=Paragonimus heterotremus TaxID=100268 RepID=A0A8J4T480_9TREM|nr:Growth arrest-specific protein 8 [Paragonimus heterotremus]